MTQLRAGRGSQGTATSGIDKLENKDQRFALAESYGDVSGEFFVRPSRSSERALKLQLSRGHCSTETGLAGAGEDRFECSFDKVPRRSLYPVTYLLPLKERPDRGRAAARGSETRRRTKEASELRNRRALEDRSLRRSIPDARRYLGIRLCAAVYPFERISRYGYPATALMSYCAERGAAVMPGIFIPARELCAIPAIRAARVCAN